MRYRERNREEIRRRQKTMRVTGKDMGDPLIRRKRVLVNRYGTTPEAVAEARRAQDGRCPICGRTDRELVVDHDHALKVFRALLCRPCNLLIGYAYEDEAILQSAIFYIARHRMKSAS